MKNEKKSVDEAPLPAEDSVEKAQVDNDWLEDDRSDEFIILFKFIRGFKKYILLYIFACIVGGAAGYFLQEKIPRRYRGRVLIAIPNFKFSYSMNARSGNHSMLPDMGIDEFEVLDAKEISKIIEDNFKMSSSGFYSKTEPYISKIELIKSSSFIAINSVANSVEELNKFFDSIFVLISEKHREGVDEYVAELRKRREFVVKLKNRFSRSLTKVQQGLRVYGFSAILIKEQNSLEPKIAFLDALVFNMDSNLNQFSKLQISVVNKSNNSSPFYPNVLIFILGGLVSLFLLSFLYSFIAQAREYLIYYQKYLNEKVEKNELKVSYENLIPDSSSDEKKSTSVNNTDQVDYLKSKALTSEIIRMLKVIPVDDFQFLLGRWKKVGTEESFMNTAMSVRIWTMIRPGEQITRIDTELLMSSIEDIKRRSYAQKNVILEAIAYELSAISALGSARMADKFSILKDISDFKIREVINYLDANELSQVYFLSDEEVKEKIVKQFDEDENRAFSERLLKYNKNISKFEEEKLDRKVNDFIEGADSAGDKKAESVELDYDNTKVFFMSSLPLEVEIKNNYELCQKDPEHVLWLIENSPSISILPFLKDDFIASLSNSLSIDFMKDFLSILSDQHRNKLLKLQNEQRREILVDMVKRLGKNRKNIDFEQHSAFRHKFRDMVSKLAKKNIKALYEIDSSSGIKKVA